MRKPEQIAKSIVDIISEIRIKCHCSKILLQGVLPYGSNPNSAKRKRIILLNELLAGLEDNKSIFFQNLSAEFLNRDGTLSREVMPDFLHLSKKGYTICSEAIKEKLQVIMN